MAELPTDESRDDKSQVIFPAEDLWVPVACVNGNVHILPGIPRLFEKLLQGLKPILLPRLSDPEGKSMHRYAAILYREITRLESVRLTVAHV
jgi:hypothetical protein